MIRRCFTFFAVLLLASPLLAEYRAFELEITDQTSGVSRKVVSNLDDIQYRGYYPVTGNELIRITDTWMCRGRTDGYAAYCANPKAAPSNQP